MCFWIDFWHFLQFPEVFLWLLKVSGGFWVVFLPFFVWGVWFFLWGLYRGFFGFVCLHFAGIIVGCFTDVLQLWWFFRFLDVLVGNAPPSFKQPSRKVRVLPYFAHDFLRKQKQIPSGYGVYQLPPFGLAFIKATYKKYSDLVFCLR